MSRRRLRNGAAQRRRAKRKATAKNGAENGAAPKAKIAKKVGRRTKCTEDYVPRFLERIEAGQSVPAAAAVAGLHISTGSFDERGNKVRLGLSADHST